MRAVEVRIHNVRSVHDITVKVDAFSLIAGANNAGKSNVIDAIRLFYGDLKWVQDRDAPKVPGSDDGSWVEIEFQPTEDELTQLKNEYRTPAGTFRVRNYLSPTKGPDGKLRAGYYAYENGELSENLFYGAKNVGSGKLGGIVYIPAVSRIDDTTKLSGPSALRDLLSTVLDKVVTESEPYKELSTAFTEFESSIRDYESTEGNSLALLEQELSDEIEGWDASFSISIDSLQPADILKTLVKPKLTDESHGGEVDQDRFGAGFQRHLIFTLIRLAAKHTGRKPATSASKKEFSPRMTWILYEEPEAFLHPPQEDVLHDSLLELVEDGVTQVLLTTHSSRFVSRSMNDLIRLIRLRRERGVTSCYQLSQAGLDSLLEKGLGADAQIDPIGSDPDIQEREALLSALKAEIWLHEARAAAFFSQRVILVEGPSETALYRYLLTRKRWSPPVQGLSVIDCIGKYNIHRFIALLSAFGVDHSVLFDADGGGPKHNDVAQTILDAKTAFTKRIACFSNDLESALGIPNPGKRNRRRKPQLVLYHLESNKVEEATLTALKNEFNALALASDSSSEIETVGHS